MRCIVDLCNKFVNTNKVAWDGNARACSPGKGSETNADFLAKTGAIGGTPAASPAARKPRRRRARERNPVQLGALEQHLGYFIRRAQVWVFTDFIKALKVLEISPAQYSVLVIIDANTGLSQSALAQTLGIQRARLVRVLDRLEMRGLTRRLQSADDGRTHALQLTPKGQATLRQARKLVDLHEARLIDRLGADSYRAMKTLLRDFQMSTMDVATSGACQRTALASSR